MKKGFVFDNRPMLIESIVVVLSFLLSFSPLLAAETIEFSEARITRNLEDRVKGVVDSSAILAVADFDLENRHVDNEVLVKFADWTPQELVDDTLNTLGANSYEVGSGKFHHLNIDLSKLRLPREREDRSTELAEVSLRDVLDALDSLPHVDWVEPNYIATAFAVPNDPNYNLQWNFPMIGLENAWNTAKGDGVVVAIVDTGVAYERYAQYSKANDLGQTSFVPGYNFVYKNTHPNDDNGHGTHIAGTIAGSTNDNFGVAGIAYKASIMPLKALDKAGSGTYSNIAEAIRYAADNGANIINLSLGGPSPSNALREAVDYAASKGVLLIGASGNAGTGYVMYPAAYDNVVSVGAIRYDKKRSPYSNYGTKLDLVAPGGDTSQDQNRDGYPDGILQQTLKQNSWGPSTSSFNLYYYQGTSMAAPHVAGVAALIMSVGITDSKAVRDLLIQTAEDLDTSGWDAQTGYGLVRADMAVARAASQLTLDTNDQPAQNQSGIVVTEDAVNETSSQKNTPTEPSNNQEPAQPAPKQEIVESVADLVLDVMTYNMFGKKDMSYAFWEQAILGIAAKDSNKKAVSEVDLDIKVYDSQNVLVAKGGGSTDFEGELLLDLGSFARGVYTIVVEAVAEGFKSAKGQVNFRFR